MSEPLPSRVYGISPGRRNVLVAVWLVITVPLALAGLLVPEPALLLVAGIVTAILVPIYVLAVAAARLLVSDDGIELRQLGLHLSTSWDNVAGLHLVRGREGLVLHHPLTDKGAARLAAAASMTYRGVSFYDAERRNLIMEHRFIPIEAFAYWFEHGDLRAMLTARVPALSAPAAWTPRAPARLPPRRVALIVAIILAALGLGIALALASAGCAGAVPPAELVLDRPRTCAGKLALQGGSK